MARLARQPLLRCLVYPAEHVWAAGPALTVPTVRFAVPASVGSVGQEQGLFVGSGALLAPDQALSVLPFYLRSLASPAQLPEVWRSRPVPPWRGVTCRFGAVAVRFQNEIEGEGPATLNALVLVPDREPPGPRLRHLLLGTEFLLHYGFRVLISFDAITFLDDDERRGIDASIACGYLEKA